MPYVGLFCDVLHPYCKKEFPSQKGWKDVGVPRCFTTYSYSTFISLFTRSYISQVVQDFFHQQYHVFIHGMVRFDTSFGRGVTVAILAGSAGQVCWQQ